MKRLLPALLVALPFAAQAELCNLKIVTDASPDYYDMPSLVHSATSKWKTDEEKCWAVFYWNHKARRQTQPMSLHGMALTDPIRQFNDYGFTMCSTVSGVNQSIWEHLGLKHRYWDISNHTVSEVFYDGKWHMYDSSLSAIYTLCDGKTIAGVEDIGKDGGCEASGGRVEPGHVAKYHCLTATSPNGFLIGADCARDLEQEYRCFHPKGLKLRTYYYDWDYGHRYILNVRANEVYTRYYRKLGDTREYYVPNPNARPDGKDPESVNPRYRIRGNGRWTFKPDLSSRGLASAFLSHENISAGLGGIRPARAGRPASAVIKIQSANVITSQTVKLSGTRKTDKDTLRLSVSTDNGIRWREAWQPDPAGPAAAEVKLIDEVSGAYEVLLKLEMLAASSIADASLSSIEIETLTMLNSKTQPRLNLGKNTVHVELGGQSDSIVFWPEIQGGRYKDMVAEESNIACLDEHMGYQGVLYPAKAGEDAYIVYKMDAPRDITSLTYGGRFYNRAPRSRIEMLHSFDGKNWANSWTLTDIQQPWDVIHYETVAVPKGNKTVWVKYLMNSSGASQSACSIYAVRMEANHEPADKSFRPVEVAFSWKEVQQDRSLVERSHTQTVSKMPFRYSINVGGADHPVMESLRINLAGAVPGTKQGYSDGKDAGGEKFTGKWVTYGNNIAVGKSYVCSMPSDTNWGAGDPDGKKLTDGIVGPPYSGGISYRWGALWGAGKNVVITLDLGEQKEFVSVGANAHGYPGWDALKGQVQDRFEVLVSDDGNAYRPLGELKTNIRWIDMPVNHMWTDEETLCGATFRLILENPVKARFVQYRLFPKRFLCVTELEVLDAIKFEPFDLRIALPGDK
ncbi:MAG TPA: hypothetical protein ENN09_07015 [Planctomycetes bacterium]|nr:hypothetical protein [Planctomycetota bacterium]